MPLDRRGFLRGVGILASAGVAEQLLVSDIAAASTAEQTYLGAERSASPTFGLTKFLDPLPIPPTLRQNEITLRTVRTQVKLHSQLPRTTVWAYEGQFPGPTIEVRSGQRLRVTWTNAIKGTMPLVAVKTPLAPPETPPAELSLNNPGYPRNPDGSPAAGALIIGGVADLPAWTVTHLHGADTGAGNDGWAHNGTLEGDSQLTEYPNRQHAAMLWYHDHAMNITRWTVHAGLAGVYLIRDDEEAALGLPKGKLEIPLVIGDRNLDVDARGRLTGQLLFKIDYIEDAVTPFFGPFTLVNGVIWPHLDVTARWYRFRVVNASNARYYTLNLIDQSGASQNAAVRQIGTDQGLLPAPAPLPRDGLVLAPAERADLLIDFGLPELRGQRLRLTNTFGNAAPEPDIMEFRVGDRDQRDRFTLPEKISTSYVRLRHGTTVPHDHDQIWVGLIPPGTMGQPHSQMWELAELTEPGKIPAAFPAEGVIQLNDPETGKTRTFRRVAALFDDTVSIFINQNRWAVWNFVNLGEPAHPMHIHLARFQALFRRHFNPQFDTGTGGTVSPIADFADVPLKDYENGWKDTIDVRAGEWVSVAGQFGASTGEFMYHCHVLDHEDAGMMRPFVVQPAAVARFHMHGGHSH